MRMGQGTDDDIWWCSRFLLDFDLWTSKNHDHQAAHCVMSPFVITVYISLIKAPLMKDLGTDVELPHSAGSCWMSAVSHGILMALDEGLMPVHVLSISMMCSCWRSCTISNVGWCNWRKWSCSTVVKLINLHIPVGAWSEWNHVQFSLPQNHRLSRFPWARKSSIRAGQRPSLKGHVGPTTDGWWSSSSTFLRAWVSMLG